MPSKPYMGSKVGMVLGVLLANLDELIRTNMTPDEGNLPTKLPTICLNIINYD